MMTVQITCPNCSSSIHIYPDQTAHAADCDICGHEVAVTFNEDHANSELKSCPCCERKDFYQQRDFNRKIGVILFVLASILSIWTYGISFIVLYAVDFYLFRKLQSVAVCYKCGTIFRNINNLNEVMPFNHEMNDRITYADHDFDGKPLTH